MTKHNFIRASDEQMVHEKDLIHHSLNPIYFKLKMHFEFQIVPGVICNKCCEALRYVVELELADFYQLSLLLTILTLEKISNKDIYQI